MKDDRFDDKTVSDVMKVVQAGLIRFFPDGDPKWSKEELEKILKVKIDLNDERIQNKFLEWEKSGFIKLHGTDSCYVEVLKIPSE